MPSWTKKASRLVLSSARNGKAKREPLPAWDPLQGPSTKDALLNMLLDMYWHGVRREMTHLIRTLVEWQEHFPDVVLDDEKNPTVHGLGTFIDQLNEKLRMSADIYARERWEGSLQEKYIAGAESRLKSSLAYQEDLEVKEEVEKVLADRPHSELWERRARMLLQSAGWLDIDKLVEYRDPPEEVGLGLNIWNKPRVPQFTMKELTPEGVPTFVPLACRLCQVTIRGIMFSCSENCETGGGLTLAAGDIVCEDCFRTPLAKIQHIFVKVYKHCVLDEAVTPAVARKLCSCSTVRRFDADGNTIPLFPVDPEANHRTSAFTGAGRCRLFSLGEVLAKVKHRQLQEDLANPQKRRTAFIQDASKASSSKRRRDRIRPLQNLKSTIEDDIDGGVPAPVVKFLENFPLGNSHLSLMIGPLVIENGVKLNLPSAKSGAMVTCREPPHLQAPNEADGNPLPSIAISEQRGLFTQHRPFQERRLKACMKQVVGGAFSGFLEEEQEKRIATMLGEEAKAYRALEARFPTRSRVWFEGKLDKAVDKLVIEVRRLLEPRINFYLDLVATKLMDPTFTLSWDFFDNNCQKFCDGLLSYDIFGRVFEPLDKPSDQTDSATAVPRPLYLMSFVCRPESYSKHFARTKYDVPNGLTEEYLLKFRYGRHDHADIFDTLQEYWYDLGNFRGPLYKYQPLFPWDCTEAYGGEPTKCNSCALSKHVWSFPFDSWSLIALHLQKDRRWYPPSDPSKLRPTDAEWMANRLTLLLAQDVLLQGALALRAPLSGSCGWISQSARFDRLRLGGIHRAQPLSHHYERGRFQEAYVTPWVHLGRAEQIKIYESIRDHRAAMPDMAYREPKEGSRWGQGDGDSGFQDSRMVPTGLEDAGNGAPWVDPADMQGGGPRDAWNQNTMHDDAGGGGSGWGDSGWGGNGNSGWGSDGGGGD